MSFLLELNATHLTDEQALAVEATCRERQAWPVEARPRRRRRTLFGPRFEDPGLSLPDQIDGRHLLRDDAEWDAAAWAMDAQLLPALADAVRTLGELLPQGFTLRATWVGSEVREERVLSAEELADIVVASGLNEFTRYRVPRR